MKYSTANWIVFIFFIIGAVPVATYFYLDANDKMIPFLNVIVKPVSVTAFLIAAYILLASLMASRRHEERIKRVHFLNALVITICLITFRLIAHFL